MRGISARDLTHQALIETYAPASVLVDRKYECLDYSGPTDRYLQVAAGGPAAIFSPWRARASAPSSGR